ncbi:hypothetical protein KDH_79710 [Dictyobacter sp. S3.2.2.5]|uniref:UvrD-like helicase ATP-binding domain-containing protein n=1 Tax=Dictyobacter halimunensis TaxID=3026934 RepID=A0ABQ6G798_9CHLR|nr:hypothetical protein KDH_79710 [Dictyobacter sp. S3.2.2.5]
MAVFQPSRYQQAIFDYLQREAGHLLVKASAGSGKSTTLLEALELYASGDLLPPGSSMLVTAFNTSVVEEFGKKIRTRRLRQRLGQVGITLECCTINSLGYRCLATKNLDRKGDKYTLLCQEYYETTRLKQTLLNQRQLRKLVQFVRRTLTPADDERLLRQLIKHYPEIGFDPDDPDVRWHRMLPGVSSVLKRSQEVYRNTGLVDFVDQVWLPAIIDPAHLPAELPTFDLLLVDEAQDLNRAQLELLLRCCKRRGGRLFFVGDEHQAMYGFNGADTESIATILARTHAQVLPLWICYRCPASHLEVARQLVPEIEPAPWAKPGTLKVIATDRFLTQAQPGDLVLCRTNAPLVTACLALLRQGTPAKVLGRDIAGFLLEIVQQVTQDVPKAFRQLATLLETYRTDQLRILADIPDSQLQVASVNDNVETLLALYRSYLDNQEQGTLEGYENYVKGFFVEQAQGCVLFSTVHKAKGSEYETVYLIETQLMPHPAAKLPWQQQQECNIEYVALTRAKQALYLVGGVMENIAVPGQQQGRFTMVSSPVTAWYGMVDPETGEILESEPVQEDEAEIRGPEARPAPSHSPVARPDQAVPADRPHVLTSPSKQKRVGRPRKGGEGAALRHSLEITLDEQVFQQLAAHTSNRSGYIEQLIRQDLAGDQPDPEVQRRLQERCDRLPEAVARQIQQLRAVYGVRAAYEASEALVLYLDPQRKLFP